MFVWKSDFDKVFQLSELVNNKVLTIKIYYDEFYHIDYNSKIYDRFVKILKLTDNEKIHKYIKIIKYAKDNEVEMKEVFRVAGAKELSKSIDKDILSVLLMNKK